MGIIQRTLLVLGLCIFLAFFERMRPIERDQPLFERARNFGIILAFLFLGGAATRVVGYWMPRPAHVAAGHQVIWSVLVIFVAVFVSDLIFYWYHRAEHTFAWLWPIHELHHSDAHLNATTSLRTFWLENPLQAVIIGIPAAYVSGGDLRAAILTPVVLTIWLFFTHANWRLQFGRFTPIITGPQLHRLHHSALPQHRDRNFAQFFPVLDIIFGTYLAPAVDEFPPTGTQGLPSPVPVVTILARPFRSWADLVDRE